MPKRIGDGSSARAQPRTSCIVVGSGAGGLELAIRLARKAASFEVTLIDRRSTHIWKPRLHEIATGMLDASDEELSYAVLAKRHGFDFVLGEMTALDLDQRMLAVGPVAYPRDLIGMPAGSLLPPRQLTYDVCVMAIGSTANDFGTPGAAARCYVLDTPVQAERFHRAFLAMATKVASGQMDRIRVAIVGAGLTGVELASELRTAAHKLSEYRSLFHQSQLEISIVEMSERPLPSVPQHISDIARKTLAGYDVDMHFGTKVSSIGDGFLSLADGRSVPADLIVWASGIKGQPVAAATADITADRSGRVQVDHYLRALNSQGEAHEAFYCIGDCASFRESEAGPPLAPTAQAAHQQAKYLADALTRAAGGGKCRPFRYRYRGTLVSLGSTQAAGNVPGPGAKSYFFHGIVAKLMYLSLYRMHMVELLGWWRVGALTISALLKRSVLPAVKLHWR